MTPNLFLIGAMKAGTTTLHSWLNAHPAIYMSRLKEPNHFCADLWDVATHVADGTPATVAAARESGLHTALVRDERLYQSLFPDDDSGYRFVGEASPMYLRSRVAAANIARRNPQATILVLLRDPIDRAWSHYVMERNEARVPERFERLFDDELAAARSGRVTQHGILESGLYFAGLSRVFASFDRSQVFVADASDLRDRERMLTRLADFLEIDVRHFPNGGESRNNTLAPRFPRINRMLAASGLKQAVRVIVPQAVVERAKERYYGQAPSAGTLTAVTRGRLTAFYRDDVKQLTELLGADTPAWATKY